MKRLQLTYDADQHCTGVSEPRGNRVAIDCPLTGKGEELSPGDLVGIGVAGCMLLSMGALARRNQLDLIGTVVDIGLTETGEPFPHVDSITLDFHIPRDFSAKDRQKLERAAGMCPISGSFRAETKVTVNYSYGSDDSA